MVSRLQIPSIVMIIEWVRQIFRQARVALIRWVKEGSIFILIQVARALAKQTKKM